jgi:putative thiamine transport system permease protein
LWGLAVAALGGLLLWSFTRRWRFPAALPQDWTFDNWTRQGSQLPWAFSTTVLCGLAATLIALALVLACLEYEQRFGRHPTTRALWRLYLPLLVPQIGFLFGVQIMMLHLGLSGTWTALVWSHLLFVLPYVFLSLSDPYRALDERYARSAHCLGARPTRVFLRVKLPMLLKPILVAAAVGFAVSVAQYLPTLFAGGGRFATLTTEAVALSAGGNRRSVAVFALLQSLLPFIGFFLAGLLPVVLFRNRQGMLRS